ncbi:MAG: DMT family transporter [Vallitalea sp.]|nr:DMT family transporter [Vallitalea sp.]
MYLILALISGALVIMSISINGSLAKKVGLIQSSITNYLVGFIASIIFYFIMSLFINDTFFDKKITDIPFYYFFGGMLGAGIITLNNLLINKISAIYVTILIFLGQMTAGIVIDYFKFGDVSKGKIIGGALILGGLVYYIYGDKRSQEIKEIEDVI